MPVYFNKDISKVLIKFDISKQSASSLYFANSELKWFSGYIDPESKSFYLVKLRDLIIQGISFPEEWMEFPSAFIGDEPARFIGIHRFIRMIS